MPARRQGPSGADGDELDYSRRPGNAGAALHLPYRTVGHVHRLPGCERNETPLPISTHPQETTLARRCMNTRQCGVVGCARPVAPVSISWAAMAQSEQDKGAAAIEKLGAKVIF